MVEFDKAADAGESSASLRGYFWSFGMEGVEDGYIIGIGGMEDILLLGEVSVAER